MLKHLEILDIFNLTLAYTIADVGINRNEKPTSWFDGWFNDTTKESIKNSEILSNLSQEEKEIINTIVSFVYGEKFHYPADVNNFFPSFNIFFYYAY